jgi:GT2 family glycosyltransferase
MLSSEVLAEARQCIGREPDACYAPNFVYHGGIKQAGCQAGYTRLKLLSDMIETNGMAGRLSRRLKANPKYHATDWNWPLGTCFFVLKEHFLEVGGFDPAYFVYMEDVELGLSLKLAGKETRPLCGTLIHAAQTGSDICSDTRRNLVNDGRLKYARKHYGRLFYGLLRLIAIAGRRYGIRSCNR